MSDAIIAIDKAIEKTKGDIPVAYVGGIPTILLNDPNTTIHPNAKHVTTSSPKIEDLRTNGTPRDIDILYLSNTKQEIEAFFSRFNKEIHKPEYPRVPSVSISAYETEVKKRAYIQLVAQMSKSDSKVTFSVGDVKEVISAVTFEDLWTVQYQERKLTILHPVAHAHLYRIRSVAGLRQKDKEKIGILDGKLRDSIPKEAFEDFSPLLQLEQRLQTDLSIMGILKAQRLDRLGLLLSKKLMQTVEARPSIMTFLQSDSPLIKSAVRRAIRSSTKNFKEVK